MINRPKLHTYAELRIDGDIAPLLAPSKVLLLEGVVVRLDQENAYVATVSDSPELVDWVFWLTKRKHVQLLLVSRETFRSLMQELRIE